MAHSIAIFTDTAHLASDVVGFGISMIALKMTFREASKELTFGWHRAEIIGTMGSVIFLLTITMWLLTEAIKRMLDPQEVKAKEMMITAVMGLFFNLIQMKILHQGEGHYHLGGSHDHDHDHGDGADHHHEGGAVTEGSEKKPCGGHGHEKAERNINVDAAMLHALGDMIMSIGVCIAAGFILYNPKWVIADPICTVAFSIIVCVTVTPVVKNCINVLMEGSPSEVDSDGLIRDMKACGEEGEQIHIHDFHPIFGLSPKVSTHLVLILEQLTLPNLVLKKVTEVCKTKYKIDHVTI